MKRLSSSLKKILAGLANQHAGEFLTMHDKMKILGVGADRYAKHASPPPENLSRPAVHRIAFISDGGGAAASLDYAVDACSRQGAKIDLLVHDATDSKRISALENRIQAAGVDHQRIDLGSDPVDGIVDYIRDHPALIMLVAMLDDSAATKALEAATAKHGGRIPAPLVLINERPSPLPVKLSAA
jgi:hypothetical protein